MTNFFHQIVDTLVLIDPKTERTCRPPLAYSSVALEELPLCNQGMRLRKLEGFPICKKGPFRISAQQGSQQKKEES